MRNSDEKQDLSCEVQLQEIISKGYTPDIVIEEKDVFYIVEVFKTENIERDLNNENVLVDIKNNLRIIKKRKLISEIMAKINQKT